MQTLATEPASPTTAAPAAPTATVQPAAPDVPPARAVATKEGPPGGGRMGARAVYRPLPPFPEALRQDSLHAVAIAQFQVGADGKASVTLVQGTPNLPLNRFLLGVLQTWRFFPAMADGQAVASTIEIRIPIDIN